MSVSFKITFVAICAVALLFVVWRLILPLALLYIGGVGVEIQLPKWLVTAHPRLAVYLFVLGGPLLFLVLLAAFIWLLRMQVASRWGDKLA